MLTRLARTPPRSADFWREVDRDRIRRSFWVDSRPENKVTGADYVVVGAGSAGCAVARRLAESGASVVLLEAGGADDKGWAKMLFRIPGAINVIHSTPQLKKLFDWGDKSTPQRHALDRTIPMVHGRILGGSSSVNGMLFVRGNRKNFDDWAAEGCHGWAYADVLPYFRRMEDWEGGASELRGSGGPIKVTRQHTITDAARAFMDATATRLGVPKLDDYNGESQEGVAVFQQSAANGVRYSASKGYLHEDPLPNLTVLTGTKVTKVVIEGSRATGVEILVDGGKQVIGASREVVVSAGVFGSPQILQLSGIGPAAHLKERGIAAKADLPVGDNLHDHLFVPLSFAMKSALRKPTTSYFLRGLAAERCRPGSSWAAGSSFESVAFVRTSHAREIPDLQLLSLYWVYPSPNQDSDKRIVPATKKPGQSIFPALIYPESRGTVRLASADPTAAPLIDPAYLTAPKDTEVLLEGIDMVREIMAGTGDNKGEIVPGADFTDEAAMREELPNRIHTVYHPVGSVRMGVDERAVVDPQLRVRGIDGLRVADASIMPSVTGGNTNAPTIMIGEKCADLILYG
ncbi:GMC family oxidoreductase [Nocardia sp. NPDC060259]|uniref:GMC family oxidoreductase n=1 Tax=Nocardia sp. NPDC060259 TaxID=3347088 RepID=UPI0036536BEF